MWLGGAGTLCVVIFSIYLATFSGEWLKTHLPELRYIPTTWRPHRSENDWTSLQALLFEGNVDYVSRRPQSVFSNRLVLDGQSFVVDPEKLDKITVSRSFRGRDLRLAMGNELNIRGLARCHPRLNSSRDASQCCSGAFVGTRSGGREGKGCD